MTRFGKTTLLNEFPVGVEAYKTASDHHHKYMHYDKYATIESDEDREFSPLHTKKRGKKSISADEIEEIRTMWYDQSRPSMAKKCTSEDGKEIPRYNLIRPARITMAYQPALLQKFSVSTILKYKPKCVKGPKKRDGFCPHCVKHANVVKQLKILAKKKIGDDEENLELDAWHANDPIPKIQELSFHDDDKTKVEEYLDELNTWTSHKKLQEIFEDQQRELKSNWPSDTGLSKNT